MDSRDKKTHLELLSPAGSRESLIAAVQNGADAVYMGGGNFNARRNAKNFSEDELFEAIDYCHINKRKCYITVNKNAIPNDPEKPFVTSGVRIGTPAVTSRGLKEDDIRMLGHLIGLCAKEFEEKADFIRAEVTKICDKYPIYD